MNKVLRIDETTGAIAGPSGRNRPAPLPDRLVLGMPHLNPAGLSETWLLKELGHRHWFMLAQMAGMPTPCFRDADGEPVYAAFCALSITHGDFAAARENDVLILASRLARVSRTQVASRHILTIEGRCIGEVELVSAFVRRAPNGGNHSVARITVDGLPAVEADSPIRTLSRLAVDFRAGRVDWHLGFDTSASTALASSIFEPCPSQDFNGAGFLYFTSYLSFVDRAEWLFDRQSALSASTVRRDVFFRANVDPGESILVELLDVRPMEAALAHRCRIKRCGDGGTIADIFSIRTSNAGGYSSNEPRIGCPLWPLKTSA